VDIEASKVESFTCNFSQHKVLAYRIAGKQEETYSHDQEPKNRHIHRTSSTSVGQMAFSSNFLR
jgi:hypothetical protein